MTHWARQWIGTPYAADAIGGHNCWTFARAVWAEQFDVDVPAIPDPGALIARARLFGDHPERENWRSLGDGDPWRDGDGVLLSSGRRPIHCGVVAVVDGRRGILHCVDRAGGVWQESNRLLLTGWRILGVYRWRGSSWRAS